MIDLVADVELPVNSQARMRLDVYCAARADSHASVAAAIHSRLNEIPALLRDGQVSRAQENYDTARWAVGDFGVSVDEVQRRCGKFAVLLTTDVLEQASQLRSTWSAFKGACAAEYKHLGVVCD